MQIDELGCFNSPNWRSLRPWLVCDPLREVAQGGSLGVGDVASFSWPFYHLVSAHQEFQGRRSYDMLLSSELRARETEIGMKVAELCAANGEDKMTR
jgi:hypothetical protein